MKLKSIISIIMIAVLAFRQHNEVDRRTIEWVGTGIRSHDFGIHLAQTFLYFLVGYLNDYPRLHALARGGVSAGFDDAVEQLLRHRSGLIAAHTAAGEHVLQYDFGLLCLSGTCGSVERGVGLFHNLVEVMV